MDPRQLGPYWLAGRLGAGGQGVVYEAYDSDGVRVAVKALHLDADHAVADQLSREVRMLERVAPFCTAKVVAVDLDHVPPYVASQYIPGPTLQQMVAAQGVYEPDALVRLAVGMATALAAIHAAGVVHRDLKPENVLIGPDGPRVIDFGIARAPDLSRSTTGVIKGTPRWMAPETFQGRAATPAVDIWAWAAILVFAATGEPPFGGSDVVQIMTAVHTVEPDLDALPQPLRALVARALTREPQARPTASELLTSLTGPTGPTGPTGAGTPVGGGEPVLDIEERLAAGQRAAAPLAAPAVPLTLGESAEQFYAALPVAQQALVPRVLLRLVTAAPDAGGTLRAAERTEFDDSDPDDAPDGAPRVGTTSRLVAEAPALVDALLAAGILVPDADTGRVALASAALVRAWPRLRAWVADEHDALAPCHELADAARRWDAHGRRAGDVLHGSALEQAVGGALTRRRHLALSTQEKAFLAASMAADRLRSRRRRQVLATVAALVLVAGTAGGYAVQQSHDAAAQRTQAALQRENAALARQNAQRLAAVNDAANLAVDAQAVRARDPLLAAQLALAAYHSAAIPAATSQLFASLSSPLNEVVGDAGSAVVERMAAQPDGPLIAVADSDASGAANSHIRIWNLAKPTEPVTEAVIPAGTAALAFVPHSARLVAACASPADAMCLWDLTNPHQPASLTAMPSTGPKHMGVTGVAVSPDGTLAAAATLAGTVIVWSIATPAHPTVLATLASPSTRKDGSSLAGVAFSSHGNLLATTILGGHTTVWNMTHPAKPTKAATLPTGYQAIGFSPDGNLLAAAGDASVGLWNLATPAKPRDLSTGLLGCPKDLTQNLDALAFRPDGQELDYGTQGSASSTGQVCRVHLDPGDNGASQMGSATQPFSGVDFLTMAWTADGHLLTGGTDGKVRSWPSAPDTIDGLSMDGNSFVATSPDGRLLAAPRPRMSSDPNPPMALYDLSAPGGPQQLGTFATPDLVQDVAFVTTTTLLTVQRDGTVQLWDLTDPRRPVKGAGLGSADVHTPGIAANFQNFVSADRSGDLAGVLGNDSRVHLWRLAGSHHATELGSFPYPDLQASTYAAVVLPDGASAMAVSRAGMVWWDLSDPAHPVKRDTTPTDFRNDIAGAVVNAAGSAGDLVAFDPAPGSYGANLHVVTVRNGTATTTSVAAAPLLGTQLAMSDDNRLLATLGPSNDTFTLWNLTDPAHPRPTTTAATLNSANSLSLNHTATMMAVANDTTVELWNISDPAHPVRLTTISPPGENSSDNISATGFTPDGTKLVIQYQYSVTLVATDPKTVAAHLCAATGNTVTAAQWGLYAPDAAFRKPCP
ncbi:serine/threonine-protein kinase [Streptacidiphilus jiangxiensis]|uniref:WD domain-containing protein, G-beta repeat-containing protein n=1 Tax=Streptacidiphilus jiangxiensis TaxID=235985 RepID=A0A1H7ZLK1_STRJI|nr:serine/threonine-protein kinase [Streptacidiphilus jiangxiensis]SEM59143.1 WD domain-containing protein, G-beta repeat-containing protein [Streptacidiphilus jiangxiensis]